MILGIISIALGVIAVPLSCCCQIGIFPGGLGIILGIVCLVMPARPGSPGKMLGIGGIVLGVLPFVWLVITLIIIVFNPQPAIQNNNDPFPNIQIPAEPDEGQK
jgi:hypothetical protein